MKHQIVLPPAVFFGIQYMKMLSIVSWKQKQILFIFFNKIILLFIFLNEKMITNCYYVAAGKSILPFS